MKQNTRPSEEFNASEKRLDKELMEALNLPRSPLESMENDDDWAFVVKMHAFMEVALNRLLTRHFNDDRLSEIVPKLETSHDGRGKMAFIKALDLLTEDAQLFVKRLSRLRRDCVHDVKWLGLDLKTYIHDPNNGGFANWVNSLTWWSKKSANDPQRTEFANLDPRSAIFVSTTTLMIHALYGKTRRREQKKPTPS